MDEQIDISGIESITDLPTRFQNVTYRGKRIPGVAQASDLSLGANCQLYAFEFLKEFGKEIPDFRSSDLWEDTQCTLVVEYDFKPLDIFLYHYQPESYGAHVGVYLNHHRILHLSKKNGLPKIEIHEDLIQQDAYKYFIGAKRVI